jgi:hypothetical protein
MFMLDWSALMASSEGNLGHIAYILIIHDVLPAVMI